ncbi:MAG: 2TM domain-containing protein, partial [Candidatus Promineifilaceae bacterium]
EIYERARESVEARLEFYRHLAIYVGVNVLLIIINLITSPDSLWFVWPLLGWGIGIVVHAVRVFVVPTGSSLKARMIEQEIEKYSKSVE